MIKPINEINKGFMIIEIYKKFKERYHAEPELFRAPGRVNLLGEHTDYNNGFVLPAAIDMETYFAVAKNHKEVFRIYSFNLDEEIILNVNELKKGELTWANYIVGVISQIVEDKGHIAGFDLVFGGNIPLGAGLSSSAALSCGLGFALQQIYGLSYERSVLAKMGQKAEHAYAGVQCGLMDQYANLFGKENHVLKLDCQSLNFEYYKLDTENLKILLFDTQVKHSLASTEYNVRRRECEEGVSLLQKYYPSEVQSLRDVSLELLEKHKDEFLNNVLKRCLYVLNENARVGEACQDLKNEDYRSFGQKMFSSHKELQHLYEVSCPELDFLVGYAAKNTNILGARMMGGGFGGCTINLVKSTDAEKTKNLVKAAYLKETGTDIKIYEAKITNGTSTMSLRPSLINI